MAPPISRKLIENEAGLFIVSGNPDVGYDLAAVELHSVEHFQRSWQAVQAAGDRTADVNVVLLPFEDAQWLGEFLHDVLDPNSLSDYMCQLIGPIPAGIIEAFDLDPDDMAEWFDPQPEDEDEDDDEDGEGGE
jgi:hypothetical protein